MPQNSPSTSYNTSRHVSATVQLSFDQVTLPRIAYLAKCTAVATKSVARKLNFSRMSLNTATQGAQFVDGAFDSFDAAECSCEPKRWLC